MHTHAMADLADDTTLTTDIEALLLAQLRADLELGRMRDRTREEPVPPMLLLDILTA